LPDTLDHISDGARTEAPHNARGESAARPPSATPLAEDSDSAEFYEAPRDHAGNEGECAQASQPVQLASTTRKNDKVVNSKRRPNAIRDAQFMSDLKALSLVAGGAAKAGTSVIVNRPSIPLSPDADAYDLKPHTLIVPEGFQARSFQTRSSVPTWYDKTSGLPALLRPRQRHQLTVRPAQWRDITPELELTYYCWALREFGCVHAFTARFRGDVEERARAQGKKMLAWVQKCIARELKKYVGRHVQLVFVLEEDENGRLHVHGEFQIFEEEAEVARKALRVALGEWPTENDRPRGCPAWLPNMPRQHQIKTEPEPDHGHSCYITKDFWRC
jgi:hypothetical protein